MTTKTTTFIIDLTPQSDAVAFVNVRKALFAEMAHGAGNPDKATCRAFYAKAAKGAADYVAKGLHKRKPVMYV